MDEYAQSLKMQMKETEVKKQLNQMEKFATQQEYANMEAEVKNQEYFVKQMRAKQMEEYRDSLISQKNQHKPDTDSKITE